LDVGFAAVHSHSSVLPSAVGSAATGGSGSAGGAVSATAAPAFERWNVFIVREFLANGSLRDFLHDTQPSLLYRIKYCQKQPDSHTLQYPPK
jgi:hypothetical protein